MPFIPVPNTAYLTMVYVESGSGKVLTNGFAFTKETPWATEELDVMCNTAADAFAEELAGIMTPNYSIQNIKAVDLTTEDGAFAQYAPLSDNVGTRSGDILAIHSAMSVTFQTAQRGRSFRGRIFHAGLTREDLVSVKRWAPTPAALVGAAYNGFTGAIETATGGEHSVISRQQGGVELAEGETTEVTVCIGRTPLATVRLRAR